MRPAQPTTLLAQQGGSVSVELLMVILPILVLFLATVQLAFIAAAKLVVQHAASAAARAAVVVLPDDPEGYAGERRGLVDYAGRTGTPPMAPALTTMLSGGGAGAAGGTPSLPGASMMARGGQRLQAVRRAAYLPLAVLAPPPEKVLGWLKAGPGLHGQGSASLGSTLGAHPAARVLFGLEVYGRLAAAVTFPAEPKSQVLRRGLLDTRGMLHVRVTFLLHCAVPLVSRWLCESLVDMASLSEIRRALARGAFELPSKPHRVHDRLEALRRDATTRLERQKQIARELAHVEAPALLVASASGGARFSILRAEASLPVQGARYEDEPAR